MVVPMQIACSSLRSPHHFFFTPKITKLSRGTSHNTARVGVGALFRMGGPAPQPLQSATLTQAMSMRLVQSGARGSKGKGVSANTPGTRIRGRIDRCGGKLCNPNHVGRWTQHRYLHLRALEKFMRVRPMCVHNFP